MGNQPKTSRAETKANLSEGGNIYRLDYYRKTLTLFVLVLINMVNSLGWHAMSGVRDYVDQVDMARRHFEQLCLTGGTSQASGEALDAARKIAADHAVYPVMYSTKDRMTGRLSDWDDIPFKGRILLQCDSGRMPLPEGLTAYFKATISDDTLYVLAVVKDSTIVFDVAKDVAYLNDCFELFFDPFFARRDKTDDSISQIFITSKDPAGKEFYAKGKIPVTVNPVNISGGWGVEIAIPLKNDYFLYIVFDGLCMGFNIMYNNNDNPGQPKRQHKLSWSGIDTDDGSWQNPALFGALQVICQKPRHIKPVQAGLKIEANRLKRQAGETLDNYSQLSKSRPSPPIVRGFQLINPDPDKAKVAREWGANVARMSADLYSGFRFRLGSNREEQLVNTENKVKALRDNQIKAVVMCYGFEEANLLSSEKAQQKFITMWQDIARRLQPYRDAIWGYDLLNEPLIREQLPYAPIEWRALAVRTIKAIREIDKDTWIIYEVGPGGGWRGFEDLKPLPDDKVIYSFHFYQPGQFTHQGLSANQLQDAGLLAKAQSLGISYPGLIGGIYWDRAEMERQLKPVIDFQQKYRVPIFVGEFSVIAWAPPDSAAQYLRDFCDLAEKHGWSWTYHALYDYAGWSLMVEDGVLHPKKSDNSRRASVIKEYLKRNNFGTE